MKFASKVESIETLTISTMEDFRPAIEELTTPIPQGSSWNEYWGNSYNILWDFGKVTIRGDFTKSGKALTLFLGKDWFS